MSGVEFLPHDVAAPTADSPASRPPPGGDPPRGLAPRKATRRRLGPHSLTARLIVGVVSLVLLLVALVSSGTWFALRYFLSERLDQQLQTSASGSLVRLFGDANHFAPPLVPATQTVWAVAITSDGAFIGYSGYTGVEPMRLTSADRNVLAEAPASTPITVTTTDGHELRVETSRPIQVVLAGAGVNLVAVVGLSTHEEHSTLNRLVQSELIIGGSAVAIALVATSLGVRFSLRRLRRVTATAYEVAAELSPTGTGLDRRVPVDEQGTEVGQLAESMNTLLSAVETQFAARLESEQRLRQFLADASHELRTPLTSIRGYAELAHMQRAAGGDADDNLSRIESEGTRMSRLVEDLLMLARGDQQASAPPARELVDVGELIDDATRDTRAAFPERRIDAQTVPDLHLIGDHDQLLRALRNLMANAAVHTAPERPILVRCAPDGESVVIQVIDGGPGLSPDEAAHVFERFWRADKARTRARGGSGLGLSIVAAIVAAHGGTVRFDSTVEQGSTVTMRLPAVGY